MFSLDSSFKYIYSPGISLEDSAQPSSVAAL